MIPDFDENGYLPPGIHPATIEEIEHRFGRESEIRRSEMQSLRWLIDLARQVGVLRIVINGSFVTDAVEPNDVDCTLLLGVDYPVNLSAAKELTGGLPFLTIELTGQKDFEFMVGRVYATGRDLIPEGMVELIQWNLKNEMEVSNTRAKLKLLEERYEASRDEPYENDYVKELSRSSLKRMMNQMTEEILRYEAREREKAKAAVTAAPSGQS